MTQEAPKLTPDELVWLDRYCDIQAEMIAAIDEALAQPEDYIASIIACRDALDAQPVPRRWVGLTDEERIALFEEHGHRTGALVGAVEDKLKEKNA